MEASVVSFVTHGANRSNNTFLENSWQYNYNLSHSGLPIHFQLNFLVERLHFYIQIVIFAGTPPRRIGQPNDIAKVAAVFPGSDDSQ